MVSTVTKEWQDERIAIIYNFSAEPQAADLTEIWDGEKKIARCLLGDQEQLIFENDVLELPGHTIVIMED